MSTMISRCRSAMISLDIVWLSHRWCLAGQPRASERSERRPGSRETSMMICTLQACGLGTYSKDNVRRIRFHRCRGGRECWIGIEAWYFFLATRCLAARFQRALSHHIPIPGRRELRSLALGYPALHLRCKDLSHSSAALATRPAWLTCYQSPV
jgi:hypothetical protein